MAVKKPKLRGAKTAVDPERSAALKGNKNASKGSIGKTALSNVGGFVSGIVNPKSANATSMERYRKRGAGVPGYKMGMYTRRIMTLGLK